MDQTTFERVCEGRMSSVQVDVSPQVQSDPRIDQLQAFIEKKYDEHEFKRGKKLMGSSMHDSNLDYDGFLRAQRERLAQLDTQTLDFLMSLMAMINHNKIRNMDMEDMVRFETDGFFINSHGRVVIFNQR
jgi:hypothetical protein